MSEISKRIMNGILISCNIIYTFGLYKLNNEIDKNDKKFETFRAELRKDIKNYEKSHNDEIKLLYENDYKIVSKISKLQFEMNYIENLDFYD